MFKILIVEDTTEKVRRIYSVLKKIQDLYLDNVEVVIDANDAKRKLIENHYDLLILDVAIPPQKSAHIDPEGGLKLLNEITSRDRYKAPSHVIGLVGRSDIYNNIKAEFRKKVLSIIGYEENSDIWESELLLGVQHRIWSKNNQIAQKPEFDYDVAIICALKKELNANLDNGWTWEKLILDNDDTIYYTATLPDNANKRIIAACSSRMGMPVASALASKLIYKFRPKFLVMTGIMAGVSGKVKLGDVVLGNPTWDWGSGKWISEENTNDNKDNKSIFQIDPYQYVVDTQILKLINLIRDDSHFLYDVRVNFKGKKPEYDISLLDGAIASGSSVLADKAVFANIKGQHRKLLGIEMEAYAVFCAVEAACKPRPIPFSIKTIVDYGDRDKEDDFQNFGAYASAMVAKRIVENV